MFIQYVHSFMSGASAATMDNKAINFAFAVYELLGLGGVGPGREELRANMVVGVRSHMFALAIAAPILIAGMVLGIRTLWRQQGCKMPVVLVLAVLPVVILFGLAELKHWRVVGRHLLPLLFFVVLIYAAGIRDAWRKDGGTAVRVVAGLVLLTLLTSSLDIRWAVRHERERYALATQRAAEALATGGPVWWFADDLGPEFYGLGDHVQRMVSVHDFVNGASHHFDGMAGTMVTDCHAVTTATLLAFENPTSAMLENCAAPKVVIVSRREAFDQAGTGSAWLAAHGMHLRERFTGFEVWQ